MHFFGCRYTCCAVLIYLTSRCFCMRRGCPPTSVLSISAKKHCWVWHVLWHTGINGLTSIFTALCSSSRDYSMTVTTKTACHVCSLEKEQQYYCSGLRDGDIIVVCLTAMKICSGERSLDPSGTTGSWTLSLCKLQSIIMQKEDPHNHTSRIGLASRCREWAAISSQSPLNCTAARQHNYNRKC